MSATRARVRAAIMLIAPAVLGAAQYVIGAAGLLALSILAYEMWKRPTQAAPAS